MRALTRAPHQSQAVWDVSAPADAPTLRMSDVVLLGARPAGVAAGQRTWQAVLANWAARVRRPPLDLATIWGEPKLTDPGAYAFRMCRNYDGARSRFGT